MATVLFVSLPESMNLFRPLLEQPGVAPGACLFNRTIESLLMVPAVKIPAIRKGKKLSITNYTIWYSTGTLHDRRTDIGCAARGDKEQSEANGS